MSVHNCTKVTAVKVELSPKTFRIEFENTIKRHCFVRHSVSGSKTWKLVLTGSKTQQNGSKTFQNGKEKCRN